jgi:DNA-binding NtrC family response regulator
MGNILIVDDEPAIGNYLGMMITRFGHQVEKTLTATDTLAKLEAEAYQLIIADICLPDAPDAEAWICSLAQKANGTPLVLISGAPSAELTSCAKKHGVLAFLSKPFELAFIKNILKTVFET